MMLKAWGEQTPENRRRIVLAAVIFGEQFERRMSENPPGPGEQEMQRFLMNTVVEEFVAREGMERGAAVSFLGDVTVRDYVLEFNEARARRSLDELLEEAVESRREKAGRPLESGVACRLLGLYVQQRHAAAYHHQHGDKRGIPEALAGKDPACPTVRDHSKHHHKLYGEGSPDEPVQDRGNALPGLRKARRPDDQGGQIQQSNHQHRHVEASGDLPTTQLNLRLSRCSLF